MLVINKPVVSKYIIGAYGIMTALMATLGVFFVYAGVVTPMGTSGFITSFGIVLIVCILLLIVRSLNSTTYRITDTEVLINTTKLIGGTQRIPLDMIESVETTVIPFGIKLFGASFHGGHYTIPSLGRAFLAITNYADGILIKTKQRCYVITPRAPLDFKDAIERQVSL